MPENFKQSDPRSLLYHYPSLPIVKYAKLMQKYSFNQALDVAENMAHRLGYLLIPSACMHWQRIQKYGSDRRVKIGKFNYYLLRLDEMTKSEFRKLEKYIEEMTGNDRKYK